MKKMALCLALVFLSLLVSCGGHDWNDTLVTNNSEFEVRFEFNHTRERVLAPGGNTSFETRAHQYLDWFSSDPDRVMSPDRRVYFVYTATDDGATGAFYTRPYLKLVVENTTDEEVLFSERGGWMDGIEMIPPGYEYTGRIFSEKSESFYVEPEFSAIAGGLPASVRWGTIENDENGESMKVVIYFPWQ